MTDTTESPQNHLLSNKMYDLLKILALVVFPALGTLYFALAGIWGLPAAEQIVGTIVAVDAFLGVVIKLGDASYNASEARFDGDLVIEQKSDGGRLFNLELKNDPEYNLEGKDEIIFKVKQVAAPSSL